jgi:DNA replication protein DnaC
MKECKIKEYKMKDSTQMMKDSTQILLNQHLKELNLANILQHYPGLVRQAKESGISYEEFLLSLTEIELRVRADNRLKRRIKEARFPLLKTLEDFNFDEAPGLDKRLIREMVSGDYLKQHRNIIFLGKTGTGKTHLSTGLGVEACRQGVRTRFISGCALANELIESRTEKALSRLIGKYARYELLILDELGYVPFSKEGAELLFQVLAERHEKASVIITSNLGFADWTQVFGEATLTAALLDRLTHKAQIIPCTWESFRLKETLKGRDASFRAKEGKEGKKPKDSKPKKPDNESTNTVNAE